MKKPKNPLAFPCVGYGPADDSYLQEGMTLRDYFAAKAMQAIIIKHDAAGSSGGLRNHLSDLAKWAYEDAEAMLKEREKHL